MARCNWQIDNWTHTPNLRKMIRRDHARIERQEVRRHLTHEEWEDAMNMDRNRKRFKGYQS